MSEPHQHLRGASLDIATKCDALPSVGSPESRDARPHKHGGWALLFVNSRRREDPYFAFTANTGQETESRSS
jgi:hypothetical protein